MRRLLFISSQSFVHNHIQIDIDFDISDGFFEILLLRYNTKMITIASFRQIYE